MASDYRVIEEIKRLLSKNVYDINNKKPLENKGVCVVFSRCYDGHATEESKIARANLKGRDAAVYTILSQMFYSFVTCCKINAVIGKCSDEFKSDHNNNDLEGTFFLLFFWLKLFPCAYVNGLMYVCID
ncbi:hypothetical protein RFI_32102 [Reticulomyxa filosa]|uniref:Uncharacterized protein n=1 Tax=Reticulomyxa filosa TaxID=46433 RepID=X6LTP4_RETFI|nr:hypothetical protein RFI_32102 [Reticulomyxa filosa]|eukprot:ETO05293.1 hypothetical protein RFI_32102 [Reticulomyxa filosa]